VTRGAKRPDLLLRITTREVGDATASHEFECSLIFDPVAPRRVRVEAHFRIEDRREVRVASDVRSRLAREVDGSQAIDGP
jgi:hypothetical protein